MKCPVGIDAWHMSWSRAPAAADRQPATLDVARLPEADELGISRQAAHRLVITALQDPREPSLILFLQIHVQIFRDWHMAGS